MNDHIHGQQKQMHKIELITFDLDDTFWDIKSVIIAAEKNYRQWLETQIGTSIKWGTFEEFMSIRQDLIKENPTFEYDLGLLRKETIRHHLNDHITNQDELNLLIDQAYEFFLGERHKVVFYEAVTEVLENLSSQFMLGVLTNGNADVSKLGIGNLFKFSIASSDVMSNKPEPAHFVKAKEISGIDFQNTLHIGDHPINDIKGARDLGINTMWFNSQNLTWDIDDNPPIEFNHWSEFENLLSLHHGQ